MASATGKDKASLGRRLRGLRLEDVLGRADAEELAALEREAKELAEERLERKGEKREGGEPMEKDDDDEDEEDEVVEWEDKSPTNNSDNRDDDDNSGGIAQVTALTHETTLPIR